MKCPYCGYEWKARRPNPPMCPGCRKLLLKSEKPEKVCPVCGYRWIPRGIAPKKCPACGISLDLVKEKTDNNKGVIKATLTPDKILGELSLLLHPNTAKAIILRYIRSGKITEEEGMSIYNTWKQLCNLNKSKKANHIAI